jgi:hypothetical protein
MLETLFLITISKEMKKYWLVKIHPTFKAINETTGENVSFKDWRENLFDVMASSVDEAKATARLTGYVYGIDYHDIVEQV